MSLDDFVWQRLSTPLDADYPDSARSELIALVSGHPTRALEIGCHKGATGAALKRKFYPLHYVGIEVNARAADVARTRLDEVIVGDILSMSIESHASLRVPFDLIVLSDVLEHLYDPWATLRRLRRLLAPKGRIYVSLPNVRNFALINRLAMGHWTYEPQGLLDITHIRFFTRAEAVRMFAETGFRVLAEESVLDPNIRRDQLPTTSINLSGDRVTLHNVDPQSALELATLQLLFALEKD